MRYDFKWCSMLGLKKFMLSLCLGGFATFTIEKVFFSTKAGMFLQEWHYACFFLFSSLGIFRCWSTSRWVDRRIFRSICFTIFTFSALSSGICFFILHQKYYIFHDNGIDIFAILPYLYMAIPMPLLIFSFVGGKRRNGSE